MEPQELQVVQKRAAQISLAISLIVIFSGLLVLFGWIDHIPFLISIHPLWTSMKVNTAVCFVLSGISLAILSYRADSGYVKFLVISCITAIVLISAISLYENMTNTNLGIDQLIVQDTTALNHISAPGRMAVLTAINFIFICINFLILNFSNKNAPGNMNSSSVYIFSIFVISTSLMSIFKIFYDNQSIHFVEFALNLAFMTSILFILLIAGQLLARPNLSRSYILFANTSGGKLLRHSLPYVICLAITLGIIENYGESLNLYSTSFGDALLITALIVSLGIILIINAFVLDSESEQRNLIEHELVQSEEMFREFAENIDAVFWRASPKMKKIEYVSPRYEKIWGRSRGDLYRNPLAWMDSILPEDKEKVMDAFLNITQDNDIDSVSVGYRIIRPDGSLRYIQDRGLKLRDSNGKILSILGIASDLTSFWQSRNRIQLNYSIQNLLSKDLNLSEIASEFLKTICLLLDWDFGEFWIIDENDNQLRCVEVWHKPKIDLIKFVQKSQTIALSPGVGLPGIIWQNKKAIWIPDITKDDRLTRKDEAFRAGINSAFGVPVIFNRHIYGTIDFAKKGSQEPDTELLQIMLGLGEELGSYIARKYSEDELKNISRLDMVTKFLNHPSLIDSINKLIASSNQLIQIFVLDINRFNLINQAMGHHYGDVLLQMIAHRLQNTDFGISATFARLGDTFVTVIYNDKLKEIKSDVIIEKIFSVFKQPFITEYQSVNLDINIGIAEYPKDGGDADTLIKSGYSALYAAKRIGINTYQYNTPSIKKLVIDEFKLQNQLYEALANDEFVLHYQPIVNLKTGNITSVEALIRWQHPEKGLLLPGDFLAIAEQTNLINSIGEWVIQEVCRFINKYQFILPVSINISINQLNEVYDLTDYINKTLAQFNIKHELIQFEITENMMMYNIERISSILQNLKNQNFRILLDDFGTGFSSFTYLKYFYPDFIKIDKSFVQNVMHSTKDAAITRTIIRISHDLGSIVIAEGVEKIEQLRFLRNADCDAIQGYFISRPLPADHLIQFYSSNTKLKSTTVKSHLL